MPLPAVKEKGDLQTLYRDRFDGIGKFEGEYHIITDPNVLAVVHAPRKYPIHIKDDTKNELDEMVDLGVIRPVTEPTDWVSNVAYSQKSKDDGVYALTLEILTKQSREAIIIHLP